MSFVISDDAFKYLKIQRGNISHLADQREVWERAYNECLSGMFSNIKPWLPTDCGEFLDIGGGLSGMSALISHHYDHRCVATVLDGEDDAPQVRKPNETFSNRDVTRRFLQANGIDAFRSLSPSVAKALRAPHRYDLIVSFGSWCFHYAPAEYLAFVKASCWPDTRLIIEVRTRHDDWIAELNETFRLIGVIEAWDKAERRVYDAK